MERTYLIPEADEAQLTKLTDQLARRAERINAKLPAGANPLPVVTMERVGVVNAHEDDGTITRYVEIKLVTSAAQLPNHVFLAVIQHQKVAGGWKNLVRVLPGVDLDPHDAKIAWAWAAAPDCHYCGLHRLRNDTYIAMHRGTGKLMQYGSDCLSEATGIIAADVMLHWLDTVQQAFDLAEQKARKRHKDGLDTARRGWQPFGAYVETRTYLAHVAAMIRERKQFVPASKAAEWGKQATSEAAFSNMRYTAIPAQVRERWMQVVELVDDDWTMADATIKYARAVYQPQGGIQLNMQNSVSEDTTAVRSLPYAAAMFYDFVRSLPKPDAPPKPVSQHVGTPNQWLRTEIGPMGKPVPAPVELTVVYVSDPDAGSFRRYGRVERLAIWHLLTDAHGNAYSWNSYDGIALHRGETVKLTAKVLKHETHPQYGARTVIGWVTVLREQEVSA